MDSARAKNIILLLLLAFNIFLLTNIVVYARGQGIPRDTIKNTVDILKSRGVALECAIPDYNRNTPKLIYGNDLHDYSLLCQKLLGLAWDKKSDSLTNGDRTITFYRSGEKTGIMEYTDGKPGASVDISSKKSTDAYVRSFLKGSGLIGPSFILDSFTGNGDGSVTLVYTEKYKGYFVFDNYLKVKLTVKGIVGMESKTRKIIGLTRDKAEDITAAYQVLLGNFKSGARLTVTSIDFGYINTGSKEMTGLDYSEQLPVWRVKVKRESLPRYFNTSTGKEVK